MTSLVAGPLEQIERDDVRVAAPSPAKRWTRRSHLWPRLKPEDFVSYPKRKPLSALVEARLFRAAQAGDNLARNELWLAHLRLVLSVANRHSIPADIVADVIQEGAARLRLAIRRYDPSRGPEFSTYAWHWIDSAIRRALHEIRFAVPIPSYLYKALHEYRRIYARSGWVHPAASCLSAVNGDRAAMARLHALACPGGTHGDTFSALDDFAGPDEDTCRREIAERVQAAVSTLPPRLAHVIARRYGLNGDAESTLEEIAEGEGLTRERIRQIQRDAESLLRKRLRSLLSDVEAATLDRSDSSDAGA